MLAHILTYHSGNVQGNDYANNNLVALRYDLELIHLHGLAIVPLRAIADALEERTSAQVPQRCVAIALDDGLDFDFFDMEHPFHGAQYSAHRVMREFTEQHQAPVHATSFVIASPEARRQIADREMLGYQWINDSWWHKAVETGLFHIGNHSWDHVSPSVQPVAQREGKSGSSRWIDNFDDAEKQVRQAKEFIAGKASNPGVALFAYPYGDESEYLINEYLPALNAQHGTIAAFTIRPEPVHDGSNRWRLPRYACGTHWSSPEELEAILRS